MRRHVEPREVPSSAPFVLFVVLYVFVFPVAANAQDRYEGGAQVTLVRSGEFDTNDTGIGGRFAWRAFQSVVAEAEMSFFPGSFPSSGSAFSSSRVEGLFGVTVGPRFARARPFAKLRPGFVTFRGKPTVCILIFPPPLACQLDGATVFALDLGGGIEIPTAGRTFVRADIGDRLIRYPGPSFHAGRVTQDAFFSHDLRISGGVGVSF